MRKTYSFIFLVLLLFVLSLVFVGCDTGSGNSSELSDTETQKFYEDQKKLELFLYEWTSKTTIKINGVGAKDQSFTSFTLPDCVTEIADGAFHGCTKLISINVAAGNTVFHSTNNCLIKTATKELILGCKNSVIPTDGSVIKIVDDAFTGCSDLTSITIPNSVTSIDEGAFNGCSSLESITIPFIGGYSSTSTDANRYPLGYIFGRNYYSGSILTSQRSDIDPSYNFISYYIPSSLKSVTVTGGSIPYGAFSGCANLESITIGNGATSIDACAFLDCTGLTSLTLPNSITQIGNDAFQGCTGLTSISIPDSVTSIGSGAFGSCSGLTSITIPNNVTNIGSQAFSRCTGLTSIIIPDTSKLWFVSPENRLN